jgi:hypothetical protein
MSCILCFSVTSIMHAVVFAIAWLQVQNDGVMMTVICSTVMLSTKHLR